MTYSDPFTYNPADDDPRHAEIDRLMNLPALSLLAAHAHADRVAGPDDGDDEIMAHAFRLVAEGLNDHWSFERRGPDGVAIYHHHQLKAERATWALADRWLEYERRAEAERYYDEGTEP